MNFLIDAQLPYSLSRYFKDNGFNSVHTLDLAEKNKTPDNKILKICRDEKRILITKDTDFIESFILINEPAKIILVTTGNIFNKNLIKLFSDNRSKIILSIENYSFIEVNNWEIIVHA